MSAHCIRSVSRVHTCILHVPSSLVGCPYSLDDDVRVYFVLTDTPKRDARDGTPLRPDGRRERIIPCRGWVNARVLKVDKGQVQVQLDAVQLTGESKVYQRWFHATR